MTLPTPPRLIGRTLVATLILAALGVLWTTVRYGASEDAMLRRVERDVRTTIGVRSTHVASLARSAAAEAELIDEAVRSRARLADLFARLEALSARLQREMPHLFLRNEEGEVIEPPQLYGITDVENQALGAKYTVVSLVNDQHYWTACKEIRKALLYELKAYGIQVAYPRRIERMESEAALR